MNEDIKANGTNDGAEEEILKPIEYKGNTAAWVIYYFQTLAVILSFMCFTLFAMFLTDNACLSLLIFFLFMPLMFIDSPKNKIYQYNGMEDAEYPEEEWSDSEKGEMDN
ncbi:hypothetical protein [Eubacterium maltosivorans]|uniref:hypothetical protein n=1 Tax=Eubacterium maltosivorans TaxID=2041044 RepID=UPI00189F28A8|nr:hypothetical protein [Eubacterium maltosivorans]